MQKKQVRRFRQHNMYLVRLDDIEELQRWRDLYAINKGVIWLLASFSLLHWTLLVRQRNCFGVGRNAAGVNIYTLSRLIDHSSITAAINHHSDLYDESKQQAADLLDQFLKEETA